MSAAARHRAPVRAARFRVTIRTGLGSLMMIVGMVGVSCQGGNTCNTSTVPAEPLTTALAAVYVLSSLNAAPLPATYADSGVVKLRVLADTLRLTLSDDSYTEVGRVSRDSSSNAVQSSYVLAGTNRFSSAGANQYAFPKFLGGSATATAEANYGHALLMLATPGGQRWLFNPGP